MTDKKINEHPLEIELTRDYAVEVLNSGNELAEYLAYNLDLSQGDFYALTAPEANLEYLYQFHHGGILPSSDEIIPIEGGYMKPIPNIDNEVSNYLFELKKQKQ